MRCENITCACKALGDCTRIKIILFLKGEKRCVCEIHEYLKLPQNLVSHHLKILREAKLITVKRSGKWMHYSLNKSQLKKLTQAFNSLNPTK